MIVWGTKVLLLNGMGTMGRCKGGAARGENGGLVSEEIWWVVGQQGVCRVAADPRIWGRFLGLCRMVVPIVLDTWG